MSKIKAKSLSFNKDPRKPEVVHLAITDSEGRVWERYSDMPSGVWGEIPLPDEPDAHRVKTRRRRVTKPDR